MGISPLQPFRSVPGLIAVPAEGPSDAMVASCETTYKLQREIGESFWLAADATPRCGLEALAATVFKIYAADTDAAAGCASSSGARGPSNADREAGAEWWVQIRGGDSPDGEAIGFHWDRDEVLADDDPPQLVHPSVATVTYLTDVGAPTMVIEQVPLKMPTSGQETVANAKTAFLSQPAAGKHIAFDGRLLHGVPPEMMLNKTSKSSKHRKRKRQNTGGGNADGGAMQKSRRITFLVNMWFNGKPTGIKRYPSNAARKHPLTLADAKLLVPWGVVPTNGPIERVEVGRGQQCGFAFGRPEDEAHEMWLPMQAGSFGAAGQSIGLKYSGKGITIKRQPPDLVARRRVKEKEKRAAAAAAAIKAAAVAEAAEAEAEAEADTKALPSTQIFEDEDWDSDDPVDEHVLTAPSQSASADIGSA
eukprot:gene22508-31265_t